MKSIVLIAVMLLSLPSVASIYSTDEIPEEAYTFEFNIEPLNLSMSSEEKLFRAVDLLGQVFASPEFKHRILAYRFNHKHQFAMNKGLTNRQIYEKILHGTEKLSPEENNAMDVEISLYSDYDSRVLGYTRPDTKKIWMNMKYFNKHSIAELAGHLVHEWLHKLGFGHEEDWTPTREDTVPYAIGYIVRDIAEKIDEENSYQEGPFER